MNRVEIFGDCSKVDKVVFRGEQNPSHARTVYVTQESSFRGVVEGGYVIWENL